MVVGSERVGPYEVLSRLGEGGMAETFLALRRGPGGFEQRVCLKRIRRDHHQNPDFVRQFLSEARIAAGLRHANIAQVLDFGSDAHGYYLALELIDGMDLRAALEEVAGGLDADLVLYLAGELATALDFAHRGAEAGGRVQACIVHRDVSPSNVLLSPAGEVKLADFGIARAPTGPHYTQTGIVKGKVPYLAPEYARSGRFDARCDLFSLGVLLYECLTGVRPYDGATDLETLERAARGERRPLSELAPAAPADLHAAVEQLIEPDPGLRFQSAAELLDALASSPPAPRARRELGRLVETWCARRRGAASGSAFTLRDAVSTGGSTEPLATTPPATSPRAAPFRPDAPSSTRRRRLGPWLALTAAGVTAAATLGVAWMRASTPTAPTQPTVEPTGTTRPADTRAAEVVQLGTPELTSARTDSASESPPPPPSAVAQATARRALLEIVVVPYGDVYVDGSLRGTAPVSLRLPPGPHVVRTDGPASRPEVRVHLEPGERKRIELQ